MWNRGLVDPESEMGSSCVRTVVPCGSSRTCRADTPHVLACLRYVLHTHSSRQPWRVTASVSSIMSHSQRLDGNRLGPPACLLDVERMSLPPFRKDAVRPSHCSSTAVMELTGGTDRLSPTCATCGAVGVRPCLRCTVPVSQAVHTYSYLGLADD